MRKLIGGLVLTLSVALLAVPAAAQGIDDCRPEDNCFVMDGGFGQTGFDDGPGFGPFVGLFVVFAIFAVVMGVYRFSRVKEMGMNRGMNERDATTAALFSNDPAMVGMILRDEDDDAEPAAPSVEQRLQKLEDLRSKGVITDAEASKRRSEILDEI